MKTLIVVFAVVAMSVLVLSGCTGYSGPSPQEAHPLAWEAARGAGSQDAGDADPGTDSGTDTGTDGEGPGTDGGDE